MNMYEKLKDLGNTVPNFCQTFLLEYQKFWKNIVYIKYISCYAFNYYLIRYLINVFTSSHNHITTFAVHNDFATIVK